MVNFSLSIRVEITGYKLPSFLRTLSPNLKERLLRLRDAASGEREVKHACLFPPKTFRDVSVIISIPLPRLRTTRCVYVKAGKQNAREEEGAGKQRQSQRGRKKGGRRGVGEKCNNALLERVSTRKGCSSRCIRNRRRRHRLKRGG